MIQTSVVEGTKENIPHCFGCFCQQTEIELKKKKKCCKAWKEKKRCKKCPVNG
jgi:hypothetical protein